MRWWLAALVCACAAAGESRVADAAKRMDAAAVRALLAEKADVNAPQMDGTTALHWAVRGDDVAMAASLIRAGAKVDAANRYGVTPLWLACTNGNGAMVQLLLNSGADANAAVADGEAALMTCSRTGSVDAVNVLLARGAVVDAKERARGQTALMWAAAEGHAGVVEALLKAGADPHYRLDSGFTAFLLAVREGQAEVVRAFLAAGEDVNRTIEQPQVTGRKLNPGRGAPRVGTSALHLAAVNAHFELAAMLLDAGANPNAMGPGYSVLHMISNVRKPGGGDNDPTPRGSGTMTSVKLVRRLAAHGANLNARMTKRVNFGLTSLNTNGATPFFLAARTGDAELMGLLAELGADPLIPNVDGSTPLMAAAGLGTRSPGEDAGTESEVMGAVRVALELGNNIDVVDQNGETAMHSAAYKNLPGVVELLASKGADIGVWNRPNSHGWTPFNIAEGYRFGNYKPSAVTVAAFERVMLAAGVRPEPYRKPEVGVNSDYRRAKQ